MMLTKKEPETFTYEEAAAYIEEIPKFTKKHTLEHTKTFLKRLGNPAADRKIVHVAGTNGKGSVCAYLQAILMAEGKRTGFFTSPHLVSVNERIRVDNIQIDNETFLKVFRKVLKIVRQMVEDGIEHPSYFEFLFGMGMTAFAETDVEYIILETGLGGRLDATNAIDNPALAIITQSVWIIRRSSVIRSRRLRVRKPELLSRVFRCSLTEAVKKQRKSLRQKLRNWAYLVEKLRKMRMKFRKFTANILHFPDGVRMIKMLSFRYRCADVTRR